MSRHVCRSSRRRSTGWLGSRFMCFDKKGRDRTCSVHGKTGMPGRGLHGFSTAAVRVAEPIAKRTETVYEVHGSAEDRLDRLLGVLVGRQVELLCSRRIQLGKVVFVRVGLVQLIQYALADGF